MAEMGYGAVDKQGTVEIALPDTDGLHISGQLYGALDPDQPIVVMMHGRPGDPLEPLQINGANYLYNQLGLASLRLAMYNNYVDEPGTRRLVDCTLETHVDDFETVVGYLRGVVGVSQIFAVGHSYGGLTILKSTERLAGAALWDPSHGSFWRDHRVAELNGYWVGDLWIPYDAEEWIPYDAEDLPLGRAMVEADYALGDTSTLAGKPYPLFIASAIGRDASLSKYNRRYAAAATAAGTSVKLVTIDAGHQFDETEEKRWELYKKTGKWLQEQIDA
ncbi:MAG TPA: alpha/beta fold hydrolase [Candidatus Saccharimonadales bacterium]|nr:alpha/beta fold hydrolase [Candidatus Saccharimonadales bacterium]